MTGVTLEVNTKDLDRIQRRLNRLAGFSAAQLLADIGGHVESSTRRRIGQEKVGPGRQRWASWSPAYAATRHAGQSLLQGEGDLLDSISSLVIGDTVEVGSNLVYAATHQFGDDSRSIPARPYLGLSSEDVSGIDRLSVDALEALLQ